MAQSTILAAGVTEATSTDVVVAAGESVKIGIFGAAGARLPFGMGLTVLEDTPSGDNVVVRLDQSVRSVLISAPGTYRVARPAYTGDGFGVFSET